MIGGISNFRRRLLKWYEANRRDLPWRVPRGAAARPNPYHVLVSEAMLQQTQVATVVPYFQRFLHRFPKISDLAAADEQDVLRLWQGLGYYSRARNLLRAAREVVNRFGGEIPASPEQLLGLPGIGRYTAGAIASIAFDIRAPILDGNVTRVLCRLDRITANPRSPASQRRLWERAAEVLPRRAVGEFNSALMELGATVCVPRTPRCLICPVREHCEADQAGLAAEIPIPRKVKPSPLRRRTVLCLWRDGGAEPEFLIEQRPPSGRWAGMWQFLTLAHTMRPADWSKLGDEIGAFNPPRHIATIRHQLTHRRYEFRVFAARATAPSPAVTPRRWSPLSQIQNYPLPRTHAMILEQLCAPGTNDSAAKSSALPAHRTLATGGRKL